MRASREHSFSDRLMRANIGSLTDEQLLIAICSDSPNSADTNCEMREINGKVKIQICAVAQILRDFPGRILNKSYPNEDIQRLEKIIHELPADFKREVILRLLDRLQKNTHTAPGGQGETLEVKNGN